MTELGSPQRSHSALGARDHHDKQGKQDQTGVLALLRLEAGLREVASIAELRHFLVNETWKLAQARQTFLFEFTGSGTAHVTSVSSLAAVDRDAPLVRLFESVVGRLKDAQIQNRTAQFRLEGLLEQNEKDALAYPFREVAWLPLVSRSGQVFGGLLLTREAVWRDTSLVIMRRLSGAYSHAWMALDPSHGRINRMAVGRSKVVPAVILSALVVGGLMVPVPMSGLAPAEVVALGPEVVTAPLDGVIAEVLVSPNETVSKGEALIRFAASELESNLRVAEQKVLVAEARLKRARQSAFADQEGRRELVIAEAELALKRAESEHARHRFSKAIVRAERSGLALYSDRKDLVGRPVSVGERLMEIAEPSQVQLRIDMSVSDAPILKHEAAVVAYLDSDPLKPLHASIAQSDYRAREIEGRKLAVRSLARFEAGETPPRLGTRGTAKVFGGSVPLFFYLFRRPISATRQWLGI